MEALLKQISKTPRKPPDMAFLATTVLALCTMKTIILILCAGLLTAGFAALAAMLWWAWAWFRKRSEIPPTRATITFRTTIYQGGNLRIFT